MREYIEFQLAERQNPKTKIWSVIAKSDGFVLGTVSWYGPWRQYTFSPTKETTFNHHCLLRIKDFLTMMNADHLREVAKRKEACLTW